MMGYIRLSKTRWRSSSSSSGVSSGSFHLAGTSPVNRLAPRRVTRTLLNWTVNHVTSASDERRPSTAVAKYRTGCEFSGVQGHVPAPCGYIPQAHPFDDHKNKRPTREGYDDVTAALCPMVTPSKAAVQAHVAT